MAWELNLIECLQGGLGSFGAMLGRVCEFISGETGLLVTLLLVMFCWKKEVGQRLSVIIAAVNTWLPMIKFAVQRPRPYMEYPGRVQTPTLSEAELASRDVVSQGFSFPSMHSASAAALYIPIAQKVNKRWMWVVSIALTALVGIRRVVVGMHYPTDVLAGWALGFAAVGIFYLLDKYVKNEWLRDLIILATTLPGLFFVRTQDYFTSLGMLIGAIAAIHFERKYIRYEDTRNVWAMILRMAGAFAVYFVLNTLLKMPFSKTFLDSGSLAAFLVRTARYAVNVFVLLGVYPLVFPLFEKVGKKNK